MRPTAPEPVLLHVGPVVLRVARLEQTEHWTSGRPPALLGVEGKAIFDEQAAVKVLRALIGRRETSVFLDGAAPVSVHLVALRFARPSTASPWTFTLEWIAREFLPRPQAEVAPWDPWARGG